MTRPVILDIHSCLAPTFPRPDACPQCQSRNFLRIAYGHPTEETIRRAQAGEFTLGGCILGQALWYCKACGLSWPRQRPRPTDEEWLAYRLRAETYGRRPDVFLTRLFRDLRWHAGRKVEKYLLVPWLIRREKGRIHAKLRLSKGGFRYVVRFRNRTVKVDPDGLQPGKLDATCCTDTLSGSDLSDRYRAAAIRLVRKALKRRHG
jgi:hypothetical protein